MRGMHGRAVVGDIRRVVDAVLRDLLGPNDPEHEDLAQSSMEYVLRTMDNGSYRGACPLRVWAATIARNAAIDLLRSRSRDRRLFAHDESDESVNERPSGERGPDHLAETRRRVRDIEAAMVQLGPAKAEVVYLHDALGYQLTEVAATLGISVAAAQSRLVRGRREIIDWMVASGVIEGQLDDPAPPSGVVDSRESSPPGLGSACAPPPAQATESEAARPASGHGSSEERGPGRRAGGNPSE
jgi:RNA polymerase sigma factor (sigma-70 family)